jgi:hypothetical protein
MMPSLLALLLAVAATLTFSFFGFLTSRLLAPVPLDMESSPDRIPAPRLRRWVDASRRAGLPDVSLSARQGDAA